ncbi:hypothetical protein M422DRAFT_266566 [Sphaerobolus stellatus SS14]|uniref:Uncharacterized protein n=1 Tax=Sphaerobolus stellatus (strain SS14) TaxID=990650 RepID=A0A0C9V292_SPHS4|nr:hypothetical protein M422DRAFT_266566 [Sphaerobolus stellatus SS14]
MPINNFALFSNHVQASVALANHETPSGSSIQPVNARPQYSRAHTEKGAFYDEEVEQDNVNKAKKSKRSKRQVVQSDDDPFTDNDSPDAVPNPPHTFSQKRMSGTFSSATVIRGFYGLNPSQSGFKTNSTGKATPDTSPIDRITGVSRHEFASDIELESHYEFRWSPATASSIFWWLSP